MECKSPLTKQWKPKTEKKEKEGEKQKKEEISWSSRSRGERE